MALCEQGYLCDVCGQDVAAIVDSDLYLRYVLGEVGPLEKDKTDEKPLVDGPPGLAASGMKDIEMERQVPKSHQDTLETNGPDGQDVTLARTISYHSGL